MTESKTRPDASESHAGVALISSAKVQGAHIYRPDGEKIGRIEFFMIDKASGRVAYVVMSAGGFMGMGHDHYPLPWALLRYNDRLGGYEADISDALLNEAPKYGPSESWDWSDLKRGRRVHDYWRALPYWGF